MQIVLSNWANAMIDPRSPDFEPIIETKETDPKEWTPARGLTNGMIACLIAGTIMGAGWIALSLKFPSVMVFHVRDEVKVMFVLGCVGIILGFVMSWILFTVMHRTSKMISWPCTAGVIATVLLIILARQIALAIGDAQVPELDVTGWAWLTPRRILISNVGQWIGLTGAVYLFREGESLVELFYG